MSAAAHQAGGGSQAAGGLGGLVPGARRGSPCGQPHRTIGMPMESADNPFHEMCVAHEQGDVGAIRRLLGAHPELEEADEHSTWLHGAAEAGQPGVIDFWLDRGWDVNRNLHTSKADGESTPLHYAKDAATTRHLLSRGARVNAWSRYAGTPL